MSAAPGTVPALRERVDERRRELGLAWWQVASQAGLSASALDRMSFGVANLTTRRVLEEWLRRHPAPVPAPTPDH
ncbi:putative transcriptional regulator [Nonomuraea thailandensis]|uniref:Transcriptional regulator n=1 Tax=Nonomuraea thailandensis TaxID=1188745 RepID=A0A9X2GPW0_9ACTN|nr:hypothetical protein [Nonomuraea thailandensis]MCP2363036.1 putative transcriptional regulator [Nonomuraea thailandensis]